VSALRRGYLFALAAYGLWGVFPLYFKLLRPSGATEILAHRVIWSVVTVGILLLVLRKWRALIDVVRRPKTMAGVAMASALIGLNWGVYIYGVLTDRVIETSLGYFINPLVTVLLGVIVLGERLRAAQWAALGVGAAAVAVLTFDYGRPPWIALTLACSFGAYGFIKKWLGLPAVEGLLLESAILLAPAVAYLAVLTSRGDSTLTTTGAPHGVLLVLSGVMTAGPLLFFAGAANRLPLSGLGMMQYIAPSLQFVLGVLVFHEPMPPLRLAGFGFVWCALALFTWDGIRNSRQQALTRSEQVALDPV
jgi:chloramphenicol-sensitive protein RarD